MEGVHILVGGDDKHPWLRAQEEQSCTTILQEPLS